MSRTYTQLIDLVRRWSNRDMDVLPDNIVADCLRYAADKAYRTLRIPPLEHTVRYSAEELRMHTMSTNNRQASVTEVCIPDDLIEFMYIRGVGAEGRTTRMFNEKADIRTFYDIYAERYTDFAFWSRHGNNILLSPGFGNTGTNFGSTGVGNEECVELHYYRRLPALHARFDTTIANARLGLLTTTVPAPIGNEQDLMTQGSIRLSGTGAVGDPFVEAVAPDGMLYYGDYVPNWLRDENERVVLMGALAEVFFYLQEDDEAQKYAALFLQEIQELNDEDRMRHTSGGNVQVNFNGRGLI